MYPVPSYCDAKKVEVVVAHDNGSEMRSIPVSVICNPVVDVGFMYIVGLDDEDSGLLLDGDCVVAAGVAFVGAGEEEEIASVVVGFAVGEIVVGATVVVIGVGAGVASIASPVGCTVGVPVANTTVGVPVVGATVVEMEEGCRVVGDPVVVPILPVVVGVPVEELTDGLSVVGEFVVGEIVGLLVVTITTVGANVLAIGDAVVTTVVTEEDGDTVGVIGASEEIVVGGGGGATVVAGTVGLGVGTSIIEALRNVGVSDVVALVADGDGELVSCAIMIMLPSLKVHNIKTSMKR